MTFSLQAHVRDVFGKRVKNLRREGFLPAVVYGGGKKTVPLQLAGLAAQKAWQEAGESALIDLAIEGDENTKVLIHDIDRDPVTHAIRHIDFLRVRMDEKIRVTIPLHFEGESPAVKQGGILVKVMHEAEVEALPDNLPSGITVDLTRLVAVGDRIALADLLLSSGAAFTGEAEAVVALAEEPRAEEEPAGGVSEAEQVESVEVTSEKKEKGESSEEEQHPPARLDPAERAGGKQSEA